MAFTTPQYGQAGSYTAAQDRILNAAFARTTGVRRLIPAVAGAMQGDLAVVSSGVANASVTIGLGDCFITDAAGGVYFCTNATSVVTIALTANSSGTTRTDLIYVQVTDNGVAVPTITAAVSTGSTVVPAKAIGLATIAVPTGFTVSTQVQNAWITDTRTKAQLPDFSTTNTSAVASPISGNIVFDTSASPNGKLKIYNNAAAWETVVTASGTGFTNADMATGYTLTYQSTSPPPSPVDGQLWFDTTNKRLLVYRASDTTWQRIAQTTTAGRTGATLTRATNQSIPNATPTAISFTVKSFDSDSFAATPPVTSITIPAGLGGLYAITSRIQWIDNPTSNAATWIRITSGAVNYLINGDAARGTYSYNLAPGWPAGVSAVLPLAAGDVVSSEVYQTFGGARNAQAILDCYRIGI